MDFFDKLGQKATQTYKYTTEKTSKIAKEAKLKMAMNEHKDSIEEIYTEIGKKIYQNHIAKEDVDIDITLELEEYCIQIDELSDRIEEERKELLKLKNKKQCTNCYYEIQNDYNYCPNCGKTQQDIEEVNDKTDENIDNIVEEE